VDKVCHYNTVQTDCLTQQNKLSVIKGIRPTLFLPSATFWELNLVTYVILPRFLAVCRVTSIWSCCTSR